MYNRVGHHSTSDDSYAYRARSEVEDRKRIDNPIARFKLYIESKGWWDETAEEELKARLKADVMKAFKKAEAMPYCEVGEMFTDVYGGEQPWNIVRSMSLPLSTADVFVQKEQREELAHLLRKYGNTWKPWSTQLKKHKNKGEDLVKAS